MRPSLTGFRFEDATTVMLRVGAEKKVFYAHRELLNISSPFFKAALQGKFREASDTVLELPEDNVQVIEDFLKWMYTGQYGHPEHCMLVAQDTSQTEYMRCTLLYGFAEKIGCAVLKQHLIDNLFAAIASPNLYLPNMLFFRRGYELTPARSALRKLFVAMDAFATPNSWFTEQEHVSELAKIPDHAAELAAAFAIERKGMAENPFRSGKASKFYDEDMLHLEREVRTGGISL